ncbi:MAG: thiamine pyrophosphate-binding protein [Chloroflexi bacterium]|nr:thiamine pyrophosphate-binding protein [Chloroflexota bacterium]
MKCSGADLIVKYLKAEGVEYLFGLIGSAVLDLLDSVSREPAIKFIPVQHEQAAAFMADGYARVTGRPGICTATVGPGATNVIGGVAQAFAESSPVIALLGDISTLHYGKGSSNFHEVEQINIYKPVTKLAVRIEREDRIVEIMRQAFRTATTGRKGPVYVGLPRDVQKNPVEDVEIPPVDEYRPAGIVRGDEEQIARAADLLLEAKRPVIIAGGGIRWSRARDSIVQIAELLRAPVVTTMKGVISDEHPYCLGPVGTVGYPAAMQTIQQADVILAFGCTFSQVATASFGHKVIPAGAKIIHVDIDPTEIGKSYPVKVGIVGDAGSVARDLLRVLDGKITTSNGQWEQYFKRAKESWQREMAGMAASDEVPIRRMRLLGDMRKVLDANAVLAAEAGSTHGWFMFGYPANEPILEPGGYSIMGSAFCMALAAKLARPERQVVSMIGDGAFMLVMQELATAVAQNIPVVTVVCHNSVYGNMRLKQHLHFDDRYIGTGLYIPNLAEVARSLGAHGERVEQPDEIIPALERALRCGKPAVLDVMIDDTLEGLEPPNKLRVPDRY